MQDFTRVMKALSDTSRVKVVRMLEQREMCACEIVDLLGLAQPTVSRHLRVLQDAGLILGRKEGVWVYYRLPEVPESACIATLLAHLPGWLEADPELGALLAGVEAENPCSGDTACSGRRTGDSGKASTMSHGDATDAGDGL
ncbi:ArsR/SmtB family transcription factor [Humidesulfovibrio sp.]